MARRAGRTVLERHEIGGQGGRELPAPPTIIERTSTTPSTRGEGGRGGAGFIIVFTLFVGYLYVSKRLDGVIMAIKNPMIPGITGLTPAPVQVPQITVPISPPSNPANYGYGGARSFTLTFPAQYKAAPVLIQASDAVTCRELVYTETYRATGSMVLAATYASIYC